MLVDLQVLGVLAEPDHSKVEGCVTLEVLSVNVGTELDQELHVLELFVDDRKMKRSRIEVVLDVW